MREDISKPGMMRLCGWVGGYALRRWSWLAAVMGSMLVQILFEVLKPWPVLFLVDYVLNDKVLPEPWGRWIGLLPGAPAVPALIGWTIAGTLLIFLLGWASGLAQGIAGLSLGQRMVYDLAADLFAKLQHLSLRFHSNRSVGDSIRRVTSDSTCVSVITKDALLPVLSALISLAVMFSIMWQLSPGLTVLALGVVPYMMWVFFRYANPMLEFSYREQEVEADIYTLYEESLSAMPLVQAFGREDLNEQRLRRANERAMDATLDLTKVQLRFKVLMGLATAVGTAAILGLGSHQALSGDLTIGTIILFLSYLASLYAPIETVMYTTATIQSAGGSALRVWEVLHTHQEVASKPGALRPEETRGRVRFEEVTFGYEKGRPVLEGIDLEVEPGRTVALVGETGAGKSTLVGLLLRFFDPWKGRVTLDGVDLRDLDLQHLRNRVALVLQEPFLFPMTIAENIAYGAPEATLADIEEAARTANAHDFISRLSEGYHTMVGERGASLSGGERQRISIARALLKKAPLLILDEPTSALDAETEAGLLRALGKLLKDRTTFVIAHRLSTIRRADLIVVLRQGRLAEQGTHQELLAKKGLYRRLHDRQFGLASTRSTPGKTNQ